MPTTSTTTAAKFPRRGALFNWPSASALEAPTFSRRPDGFPGVTTELQKKNVTLGRWPERVDAADAASFFSTA